MKTLDALYLELVQKVASGDPESATVKAVSAGVHQIGKKIVEEAAEVWMAAEHESAQRTAEEISQLLYWLTALMVAADIPLDSVYSEL